MASSANTKSTCTTETVRGEHRFDITGYSGKLVAGRVLKSDTFAVGGLDWAILFHAADDGDVVGYVSVFVKLVTPNASALAQFDIRMVDHATGLPRSVHLFEANKAMKRERGARKFMLRSELEASPYLREDRLGVECVLDVVLVQDGYLSETTATVEPQPSDLWRHLGALLLRQTPVGADVTFSVQGEAVLAHRAVLAARSPVFKAELSGSPAANEEVAVDGMAPLVLKTLLHFIYTDALPDDLLGDLGSEENQELVRDLLAGADRYAMNRLKQICEIVLLEPLDAKTMAAALDPAGQHRHCHVLGDGCVQFMPSAAGLEG